MAMREGAGHGGYRLTGGCIMHPKEDEQVIGVHLSQRWLHWVHGQTARSARERVEQCRKS